ncbi:hypothetical protein FIBSPDRAFT_940717 [Athelia psychrophila]|uniref:F-box domain-containing protein n=1 Tax=Athelia psychrophila TaxID=1759441 RepID=A0A167VFL2_9AGAM|nr:hypothetical protein FIBSPDRAFT_940717 [Fibularhizoctonia sp. CBS 109695]
MANTRVSEHHSSSKGMLESRALDNVLVGIFLAFGAVARREDYWAPSPGPILLGSVCRRWRAVTRSSPLLWASIRIDINRPSRFASALHAFRLFTTRSGAWPLEVSITFSNEEEKHHVSSVDMEQCQLLASALAASVERWQHFRTNSHPSFLRRIEQAVAARPSSSSRILETLWVRPYMREGETWPDLGLNIHTTPLTMFAASPQLRHVSLNDDYSFEGEDLPIRLPWQQIERLDIDASFEGCMQLLRDCPKLAQFTIAMAQDYGVEGGVDIVHRALRSLEMWVDDEPTFDCFFECVKLPSLLDLRIHFALAWDADESITQERIVSYLPTCSMLQRLVLRLYEVESDDFHDILRAVPPGLMELEICLEMDKAATIYTNELLEELTFNRGRQTPALLPNLHTLSLLGEGLNMDPTIFTTMIRSRTKENVNCRHGALLQSLYIHTVEDTESITIQDLVEVKAILGDRADIRMVAFAPMYRSPAFPDLL